MFTNDAPKLVKGLYSMMPPNVIEKIVQSRSQGFLARKRGQNGYFDGKTKSFKTKRRGYKGIKKKHLN